MKIYLASALSNAPRVKVLAAYLERLGHTITYKWFEHGPAGLSKEMLESVSINEVNGVKAADLLIAVLPGGRGTHAELGMALGLGTPVLLLNETDEPIEPNNLTCAFYWHPLVRVYGNGGNYKFDDDTDAHAQAIINETYARRTRADQQATVKLLCRCTPDTVFVNCPMETCRHYGGPVRYTPD